MSKLTQVQKEQLKRCIMDCTIRRLSTIETQKYISDRMQVEISTDYIRHAKMDIKKDSEKQMNAYRKEKFAFLDEIFFTRVEELKLLQKTLHEIIETEEDNEIRIKAANELTGITTLLSNYYEQLPGMSQLGVEAFSSSSLENNNSSLTAGYHNNNNSAATISNNNYSRWCERCNHTPT